MIRNAGQLSRYFLYFSSGILVFSQEEFLTKSSKYLRHSSLMVIWCDINIDVLRISLNSFTVLNVLPSLVSVCL